MKTARGFASGFPWNFHSSDGGVREAAVAHNAGWCVVIGLIALTVLYSGCGLNGLSLFASIPVIQGISPNSIPAGGSAQQITITGTGFNSAVPMANGRPLATVSITTTQIVATIPGGMTASPGTITIVVVDLLSSGNVSSNSTTVTVTPAGPPPPPTPDLTITKTHTGNFTQGQTGASYTITVSNIGSGPSSGTVTATDQLPPGLTATAMSGSAWTCVLATLTCNRSDALAAGASYPAITLTVNVSASASSSVTNTATVSGGGDTNANNNSASDPTTITPSAGAPAFSIAVATTPATTFTKGGTATYAVTVSNSGNAATNGTATLVVTLDPSMTQISISGTQWTCNIGTLTCTITVALAPGASYPTVTLNVALSPSAPATVTSVFMVSGAGASTAMKSVSNPVM
jgi:uncharacterized repeat protein (TIGR01451 family)